MVSALVASACHSAGYRTGSSTGGVTYHANQDGSGDCANVKACLGLLGPGDTLLLHEGTYTEGDISSIPSGTSWDAAVTVAAAPGERAVIKIPPGADGLHLTGYADTDVGFIIIDGLVFDCSDAQYNCVKFETYQSRIHDVILRNNEIFGTPMNNGVLGGGDRIQFVGNDIHDNGLIPSDDTLAWCGYGMYISGIDMYIGHNRIHDNGGWGIHHYSRSGGSSNDVIEGNYVYGNGRSCDRGDGIILASGDNTQAFNNVVFGNRHNGIGVMYGSNSVVLNNTVSGNDGAGIVYAAQSGATIFNNIVAGNGGGDLVDGGDAAGISLSNNLIAQDPLFADASSGDFHLSPGSPAIDAGLDVSGWGVTTDFDGTARPQQSGFDIGAFELP
jgi:parallel beta-helix repeat protein